MATGGKAIFLRHGLCARLTPLDQIYCPAGLAEQVTAATVASRQHDLIGARLDTVPTRGVMPFEHTASTSL